MRTQLARVLALSMIVMGTLVLSTLSLSGSVSAAGVAGTWTSRISGEGYTQTYMGPGGGMITDEFDATLELSGSDDAITGTVTADGKSFPVEGYVVGSTFYMTAHYGFDGSGWMNPTYTLTVDGDRMYGSGSYLNVGVTITGYFDLEKGGFFGLSSGMTPVVSGGMIAVSIVAIIVASSTPRVPSKGFKPQVGTAPGYQSPYQPSQQWTTEAPPQPISGDGAQPVGGVGLHYGPQMSFRPMSDPERSALKSIVRPMRINAIGISGMAMLMAVLINFSPEPVAIFLPIVFGLMGLGLAFQARKSAGRASEAAASGTVVDIRTVPNNKTKLGGWDFGTWSIVKDRQLMGMVVAGAPTSFAIVPDTKHLISVNGTPLKKPVVVVAPLGFPSPAMASAPMSSPQPMQAPSNEELPPPPEDWVANSCPKCGHSIEGNMMFCPVCGSRVK